MTGCGERERESGRRCIHSLTCSLVSSSSAAVQVLAAVVGLCRVTSFFLLLVSFDLTTHLLLLIESESEAIGGFLALVG